MIKELYKYIFRNVAGMIGISIYVLADTIFISMAGGTDGITVLNLALPLYGVLFAIGSMIGVGSATKYTIEKAKGNFCKEYFTNSILFQILSSIPFIILGVFAPKLWLIVMGADNHIAMLGIGYVRIVLIGAPFFMINYSFTSFARNDNGTKIAMIATLFASGFNIVFDYIFIFSMNMGIEGAALATAMSPVVSSTICILHFKSEVSQIKLIKIKPSLRKAFTCCKYGVSAFITEISSAVITTVFNYLLLGKVGNIGVAAYGVVANLSLVAVAIFNGIAQGMQPLLSECYGSGKRRELKKLLVNGLVVVIIFEIVIVGTAWGFTDLLVGMFNSESNDILAKYANTAVRYYFCGFVFAGVNIALITFFSSIGEALRAAIGSVLRGAVAIIGFSIVLSQLLGVNGVWISFVVSEAFTFLIVLVLLSHLKYMRDRI